MRKEQERISSRESEDDLQPQLPICGPWLSMVDRPPLAAATDVQRPKTAGATALTTSHGMTPAGASALSSAFVTLTAPLALAAATTTTPLAAQAVVNLARSSAAHSSGDAACAGVNSLQLVVSAAGKGGEGLRRGTP